jgi:holo-[acyl-carrier protein] synthase
MIGIDVVDVDRFKSLLERAPGFAERFFTRDERAHCESFVDPGRHLAGTFAAKEAAMKALGVVPAAAFARRIEIVRAEDGSPRAVLGPAVVPISISHDGPVAVALALNLPIGGSPGRPCE